MKTNLGMALLALLCAPLAAQAAQYDSRTAARAYSQLSYTLGEVRLVAEDPDRGDDADGIRMGGSALLQENFFVNGALTTLGSDNGADTDVLELGLGLRHPFTPQVDLVGIAGLVHVDRDVGGRADDDDFGPSITGGVRAAVARQVEFGGYLNYMEVFGDGDLALNGEGLYHATPNLSVLAGLGLSDDTRIASIGARWNFTPTR